MTINLTIVGCGNGGHVLAALAGSLSNVSVRILTRRPEIFGKSMVVERPGIDGGPDVRGRIDLVSAKPSEVIPGSHIIIWCGPVVATRAALELIAPHVKNSKPVPYVGCLFAQGCVHLLAREVLGAHVPFFALQNIPWLCRTITPGKKASIVGNKKYTNVACHRVNFTWLKTMLQPCFGGPQLVQLPDFSSIVLNPANQIIHPARYWGIFKDWRGEPISADSIPWLYRDFDDASAEALEGLDAELQRLKKSLLQICPELDLSNVRPLKERILAQYNAQVADKTNLKTVMATNQAYSMAKTPVRKVAGGVVPNAEHRVVQDDIPHGLCVLKDVAEMLSQETPWITKMIQWHQELMGKEYLVNGELRGRDIRETSALRVLGGKDLSQLGFVEPVQLPCKL
eukprot:m.78387 g.78387  ORF g.78387 m.78387 type:complete len:398 (+) comp20750_c0_seq3:137-1330(+)